MSVDLSLVFLILRASDAEVLDRAVFSKHRDKTVSRCTLTRRQVGGAPVLQLETLRAADVADTAAGKRKPVQASHENLVADAARERISELAAVCDQINVITTVGNCEFRRAKSGKETLLGASAIQKALNGAIPAPRKLPVLGNDKVKRHILKGDEPFLCELGISDANGRVHDKKQPKFRQINRFLELIRDVEAFLPAKGTLNICDLCCGKSYLSFAVYHYFTAIKGRDVRMVGVDMKAEVMADCEAIARNLGMDGLSFLCADVALFDFSATSGAAKGASGTAEEASGAAKGVHMVISLHACDTATDLVLDRAIEWGAKSDSVHALLSP